MKGIVRAFEVLFLISVICLIAGTLGIESLQELRITFLILGGASFILSTILRKQVKMSEE
ncbi:hypothetical protein GLW00_19770 [Halobacillus litoralis]|uniref:Uncharacterized protein n=1 Tax=Halobacillus litoralis TaxID=45668 RepID=A0A845FHS5_9BACI|nr:hypothetical protein [Halobacillus litoralis]MYL73057.1 hypothetical protein [Halobacillus litoralis]